MEKRLKPRTSNLAVRGYLAGKGVTLSAVAEKIGKTPGYMSVRYMSHELTSEESEYLMQIADRIAEERARGER